MPACKAAGRPVTYDSYLMCIERGKLNKRILCRLFCIVGCKAITGRNCCQLLRIDINRMLVTVVMWLCLSCCCSCLSWSKGVAHGLRVTMRLVHLTVAFNALPLQLAGKLPGIWRPPLWLASPARLGKIFGTGLFVEVQVKGTYDVLQSHLAVSRAAR